MVGKNLDDYLPVGVEAFKGSVSAETLIEVTPQNTEVIVNYKAIAWPENPNAYYGAGTALVPKEKKVRKK